ncbi:hypothetical protein AJ80_05793 [Polytolypa hystricis UAMH7299]|uniref:Alcohol dehydrogenase-like C-terminal domain-containing protein n=1 Tax=Polytolypa hystricis (strain UAMH7299) TaxID=1447883 RepID=A0A2B7Y0Q7_POLH7|nr:hypothetical protein AJ80_05793 [Polytolypa hystricis UAMH7299]
MADPSPEPLPPTMRALVLEAPGESLVLKTLPTPQAVQGSAVVKVLASSLGAHLRQLLSGQVFTFPTPFVPGTRCIGRIAALGTDATTLKLNQLVLIEPFVRGRDNPDVHILFGGFDGPSAASKKFMAESWRNASFAEFTRAPLENCWALNEEILCGKFGYEIPELLDLGAYAVSYGGLRGIDLKAGERVIVAPATGHYSSAAVEVASAMGANVIAASRNLELLKKVQARHARVEIVQFQDNVEQDTAALKQFGPVDTYIDISPGVASQSTHVRSCFNALEQNGRASLMGVITADIAIPYVSAMFKNLTIRGQYMYEREDVVGLVKLAESGILKLGKGAGRDIVGEFGLEDVERAIEAASTNTENNKSVVLTPWGKI